MHRQVAVRGVERRALGVFGVWPRQIQEEIQVYVGRGEEDLAETQPAPRFGVGRDTLQRAQQAAIAHAVGDDVDFLRPATLREFDQEIGDGALAGFYARFVRRVGRDIA